MDLQRNKNIYVVAGMQRSGIRGNAFVGSLSPDSAALHPGYESSQLQILSRGFSLLEIMISLSLSLFIFMGVYEVFNSVKQSYDYIQGLAIIGENGQLATYFLMRDLAQAGYAGCRKISADFPFMDHNNTGVSAETLVHGYTQQTLLSTESSIKKNMVPDSSVVSVQFMSSKTAYLNQPVKAGASWLSVDNSDLFKDGDSVLMANCLKADLIKLVSVGNNSVQANVKLNHYLPGSLVGKWQDEWFYVAKTGRFNSMKQPITALYVHPLSGRDEELVEYVSDMHAQYGYLNSSRQLHFVPASQVADWSTIKAIRILLLLNSGDNILSTKQAVVFDGYPWPVADHHLYRQWEIIESLAN
ncbi:MAG: PilW family protein [Gammaproteobacteria bacterium]|nr:PilW family protein [Gammaproteobacteria bacterium]